ncbi:RHS repeat-associated core domain-containing protein, partial [Acanthopleuribacter pedis]
GRLVQLTRNAASGEGPALVESYSYVQDTNDLARIDRYTDANGVVHQFNYDKKKRFHGTTIDNAVNLHYLYDDADNVTGVIGPRMFVQYTDWQNGYPSTMTWGDGTTFDLSLDGSKRLSSIQTADGSFALELTYDGNAQIDGCNSEADYIGAKITGVTRAGPKLREILTPSYNPNHTLAGVTVERHIGERPPPATGGEETPAPEPTYETIRFDESYGSGDKQLLQNLTLILRDQPLADPNETGDIQLRRRTAANQAGPRINSQTEWDAQVVGQTHAENTGQTKTMAYIPENGNLDQITPAEGDQQSFAWDGERRLRALSQGNQLFTYDYDSEGRRIRATSANRLEAMVFAYHGSKVVAIGIKRQGGVDWTHAVGHGPLGPAFIEDLKDREKSYYLFNDHLGTPFAYKRLSDGKVFYTPYSPHGEDWWGSFAAKHSTAQNETTIQYDLGIGFERPVFSVFDKPFLGLSGHKRDTDTGLIYMHHRYYDPALGHFLNPDFRAPDIYDPSTFTEPYSYAAGNPMMFWDPDGLAVEYVGDGRVKIEARDIHGVLRILYMPQEHWVKLVTGQAAGYGTYTGENFKLKTGTPDLTTDYGKAEYNARANAVLEHMFGPGTELTASAGEITKDISVVVVNGSLLVFGLGAGAQSGSAFVRGLTFTTETGLSGYAVYDGSIRTYEGIQEGDALKTSLGVGGVALGALGGYGSVRALAGEIRASAGTEALVIDDALLDTYVAESLASVAQRNTINLSESFIMTQPSALTIASPARGNPAAIIRGFGGLSRRQQNVLDQLPIEGSQVIIRKRSFNTNDLAALTAETGVEFAMFTAGGRRLIIRGYERGVPVNSQRGAELAASGWKWSAHTHPGIDQIVLRSSDGDRLVLGAMNGRMSVILNSEGKFRIFGPSGDLLLGWTP